MCAWEGGKWDGSPGAHVSRDTSWQGSDLGTTQSESAKPPPDISRFLRSARYLSARIVEGKAKAPG